MKDHEEPRYDKHGRRINKLGIDYSKIKVFKNKKELREFQKSRKK